MKCPICKNKYTQLYYEIVGDYNLYKCWECMAVFSECNKGVTLKKSKPSKLNYFLSFFRFYQLIKIIGRNSIHSNSILDIGCGKGVLLKIARLYNCKVLGVESNPTSHLNSIPYVKSTIEEFETYLSYDVIVMKDVLEHIKDPIKVLKKVKNWMNWESTLVISTPDIESNEANEKGKKWKHIAPTEHLFYFSEESLDYICCKVLGLSKGPVVNFLNGHITCFYYKIK